MVRCDEFYEKWRTAGNFCEKHPDTVTRIEAYLDLEPEIDEEVAKSEILYNPSAPMVSIITERACRPLINIRDPEKRKEVIQQIIKKAEEKKVGGKEPQMTTKEVEEIIHGIIPHMYNANPIEYVVHQELYRANKRLKKLDELPEATAINLMKQTIKIWNRLKILESIAFIPEGPRADQDLPVRWEIEGENLKTLIEGIMSVNNDIRVKFDAEGVTIKEINPESNAAISASLPRGLFTRYDTEIKEIGWFDNKNSILLGSLSMASGKIKISLTPDKHYLYLNSDPIGEAVPGIKLQLRLIPPTVLERMLEYQGVPKFDPTCRIVVSSKEFIKALRNINSLKLEKEMSYRRAKFTLNEEKTVLEISAQNEGIGLVEKVPISRMESDGPVDSTIGIGHLLQRNIKNTILKSDTIILGLGKDYPMVIDVNIGGVEIKYMISPIASGS